jgi:amidase
VSSADYIAAITGNHAWTREVLSWWHPADGSAGYDLLVTPTLAGPPPPIGYLSGADGAARVVELLQYTAQLNVTGQPAISLPLHMSAAGLPIGVQLVASHGREDLLVQVAAQLEAAAPWAGRRPAVSA